MTVPAGSRSQRAWMTSRRSNVDCARVSPTGDANVSKTRSQSTGRSSSRRRPSTVSSCSRPKPRAWARSRHSAWSCSGPIERSLRPRVAKAAASLAAGPEVPWRSSSASISARRRLKARSTGRGTPAISAMPRRTGVHCTPSSRDSSDRARPGRRSSPSAPANRSAGHPTSTTARPDRDRGSPPPRACAAADPRSATCGVPEQPRTRPAAARRPGRRGRADRCRRALHMPHRRGTALSCASRTASRTSCPPRPKRTHASRPRTSSHSRPP